MPTRAPCERVPCGVEHDLRILRYPVLAPLAGVYTPLFIPAPTDMPSVRILARMDVHDLHARLSVPPNMPPAAALLSISSSSTSSFARSHPTRIAGGVLLHAHGDLPPFSFSDVDGVRGRAGAYMDLDETMIHTSFVPPSHPSCVRFYSSFFLPPSPSTTRFELPFVILALVVHPSSPLPPVPLRTPTVLSLHCLLRVLGACAFTLLLLICVPHAPLFRPPIPTPPSSFPLPQPAVGRSFRVNRPSTTATSSSVTTTRTSAAPQHEHRDAAHEGTPEAQEQHYEDYDARFALKHHCTNISPLSVAPLLTGGSGQLFCG
ncbi:hypothetical protein B0H13DRAFT_2310284 [Mycena leptocephala]|nr:hypothetical protein B0H13DRAFT_2310284 [Mycena leptocephala]